MNVVQPPLSQPSDDLDGLLRAFLRSQVPQPWPPPSLLSDVTSCQRRPQLGRSMMRSRWALAASVALLFACAWILPSRLPPNVKGEHGRHEFIISDRPQDTLQQHKKKRAVENKGKSGLAADEGERIPELEDSDLPMLR